MLHTYREFPCRSCDFDLTLIKRRAGKAEMNLIQQDHRVTSKPWQ
jgi:hypothetical protein